MSRRREQGFTLIEVVVAFVLLALVMSTAFEIFSAGLARAGQLEERSRALVVAQSRLASVGVEETLKESETFWRWQTRPIVSRRVGDAYLGSYKDRDGNVCRNNCADYCD